MKVGEYVRTKNGIFKIEQNRRIKFGTLRPIVDVLEKGTIIKTSPNIIGLIEVGDYVNGHRVLDIYKDINGQYRMKFGENGLVLAHKSNYDNYYLFEEDIKSIVTKEQFESMEYKVK